MKTISDLIREESKRFNNFVYSSKPYSCGIDESCMHFKNHLIPQDNRLSITREEKTTTISIKPIKGSGKRKLYIIKLWIA